MTMDPKDIFVSKARDLFKYILLLCVWPISSSWNKEVDGIVPWLT